ncbi:hypothetical protein HED49_23010 [Ochrobactrum daejeonense]|nr:hypothetical protein [Brucella daejeonensis]
MIYKQLCVAKSALNLNDRCLAVLSSLLSFCRKTRSMRKRPRCFPIQSPAFSARPWHARINVAPPSGFTG